MLRIVLFGAFFSALLWLVKPHASCAESLDHLHPRHQHLDHHGTTTRYVSPYGGGLYDYDGGPPSEELKAAGQRELERQRAITREIENRPKYFLFWKLPK